jgi:hypothetical protein
VIFVTGKKHLCHVTGVKQKILGGMAQNRPKDGWFPPPAPVVNHSSQIGASLFLQKSARKM